MKRSTYIGGIMMLVLLFGFTACISAVGNPSSSQDNIVPTDTDVMEPTKSSKKENPTTQPATEENSVKEEATQKTPTARVGLQATNPETVVLASGEIQLVEFFAFW